MSNSPKLSVIITVYNAEKFLTRCLESVIYQTYGRKEGCGKLEDIEIILIDDGSTDKSADIYNKYISLDKRMRKIKQENAGVSAARNKGIAEAKGQYLHFIDSDDYLDLDYYEKMLEGALLTEADIAASGYRQISDGGIKMFMKYDNFFILNDIEEKSKFLDLANNHCVWRYLFKRSLIEKYNLSFENDIGCGEDMIFSISALYFANKAAIIPKTMYNYVMNPNSITHSKDAQKESRRLSDEKRAFQKASDFCKERGFELKNSPQCDLVKYKLFHSATIMHKKIFSDRMEFLLFGKFRIWTVKIIRNGGGG